MRIVTQSITTQTIHQIVLFPHFHCIMACLRFCIVNWMQVWAVRPPQICRSLRSRRPTVSRAMSSWRTKTSSEIWCMAGSNWQQHVTIIDPTHLDSSINNIKLVQSNFQTPTNTISHWPNVRRMSRRLFPWRLFYPRDATLSTKFSQLPNLHIFHNLISVQRLRSTRSSSIVTLARPPSSSWSLLSLSWLQD